MDDDDYSPPYDCNDLEVERPPDIVTSTEAFHNLKRVCTEIPSALRDVIDSGTLDKVMKEVLIDELNKYEQPKEDDLSFAIVGEMGTGKSSLINSLCGRGIIAKRGDSGDSCTWVVHRYRKKFEKQQHPYSARVHYFNKAEIATTVAGLLQLWYRAHHLRDEEQTEEEADIAYNLEADKDARNAVAILKTLFCDKAEFASNQAALQYLGTAESEDDRKILNDLTSWSEALVARTLKGQPYITCRASEPKDLLQALQRYTACSLEISADAQSCPETWPLVDSVELGIDAVLLNEGITLVDLPGVSDASRYRRQIAMKHQNACAHQIIVADIIRSKDDCSLNANLEHHYHLKDSGFSIVALTHADRIDKETDLPGTAQDRRRISELQTNLELVKREKRRLKQKRSRLKDREDADLNSEISKICRDELRTKQELETHRHTMRNEWVVQGIRETYSQSTGDTQTLPIFPICNEVYQIWADGFEVEDAPLLSLEATGVPALRQYLLALPSRNRYNAVMRFACHSLPDMLNTMRSYAVRSSQTDGAELNAILRQSFADMHTSTRIRLQGDLRAAARFHVLQPLQQEEDTWVTKASLQVAKWATTYDRGRFLDILRRDGLKVVRRRMHQVNWNDDLLRLSNVTAQTLCSPFYQASAQSFTRCLETVLAANRVSMQKIRSNEHVSVLALTPILASFEYLNAELQAEIGEASAKHKQKASMIIDDVVSHSETAYINAPMKRIYARLCRMLSFRGAPKMRKDTLQQEVSRLGGVWSTIHDTARDELDKLSNSAIHNLTARIDKLYKQIAGRLELMCLSSDDKSSPENRFRAELTAQVEAQDTLLAGPAAEYIDECRKFMARKDSSKVPVSTALVVYRQHTAVNMSSMAAFDGLA